MATVLCGIQDYILPREDKKEIKMPIQEKFKHEFDPKVHN